jgi:hypothetical protein
MRGSKYAVPIDRYFLLHEDEPKEVFFVINRTKNIIFENQLQRWRKKNGSFNQAISGKQTLITV